MYDVILDCKIVNKCSCRDFSSSSPGSFRVRSVSKAQKPKESVCPALQGFSCSWWAVVPQMAQSEQQNAGGAGRACKALVC